MNGGVLWGNWFVNKLFDLGLPEEYHLDTVADFVKCVLQKTPVSGERVEVGNSTIVVHEATVRGIKNVNLIRNDWVIARKTVGNSTSF